MAAHAIGQRTVETALVHGAIFTDFVICRRIMFGFALSWKYTSSQNDNTKYGRENYSFQHIPDSVKKFYVLTMY